MHLKDPIGETVTWQGKSRTIIGVVKNMVMASPYEPVHQTLFMIDPGATDFLNIRIRTGQAMPAALHKIEAVWKQYLPAEPFSFTFADEEYQKKFAEETKLGTLVSLFSALAIGISCLGLFGMAIFMAEQRIKEIGIRKVLGGSVFHLWRMMSGDFIKLVLIAFVIAAPVAWWVMYHWLQRYTYHAPLSWWIFAATGSGALLVTLLTVSYQSLKAAVSNPVNSLRGE